MKYTYLTALQRLQFFYTNEEGCLITPETLPWKGYSIVSSDILGCKYENTNTPVYFDITAEKNTSEENSVTIVKTERKTHHQKNLQITKLASRVPQ